MSKSLGDKEGWPQCLSPSEPNVDGIDDIDPVTEKRLLRKLDFAVLPLFVLLYLVNFVDRTAIDKLVLL